MAIETLIKVGCTIYYDNNDIEELLNTNKVSALSSLFKK